MRTHRAWFALAIAGVLLAVSSSPPAQTEAPKPGATQLPAPDAKFDPTRDADADIRLAVAEAKRTNRKVILDVGGEWCGWCHTLDRYFVQNPELRELRDKHYVWLKVNMSGENENKGVLSRYDPKIPGYPHLLVLDADGKLLKSQGTEILEEGPSYNMNRMREFLLNGKYPSR